MGGRTRHADRRADAAIRADRAYALEASGPVERHLLRRRQASITPLQDSRRPTPARVGTDPYRPLATTQADRFEPAFSARVDRGWPSVPTDRPQTVQEWAAVVRPSIAAVAERARRKRLGGATAGRAASRWCEARRRPGRNGRTGGRHAGPATDGCGLSSCSSFVAERPWSGGSGLSCRRCSPGLQRPGRPSPSRLRRRRPRRGLSPRSPRPRRRSPRRQRDCSGSGGRPEHRKQRWLDQAARPAAGAGRPGARRAKRPAAASAMAGEARIVAARAAGRPCRTPSD